MTTKNLLRIAAFVLPFFSQPAFASGDYGCEVNWRLDQREYAQCNNMAFLNPSNDTIINMQLLAINGGKAEFETPKYISPPQADEPSETPYPNAPFFAVRELAARYKSDAPAAGKDSANYSLAYGENSRSVSTESGASDFISAVIKTSSLSASERDALTKARTALNGETGVADYAPLTGLKSKSAQLFAAYLNGAQAFYNGSFEDARVTFTSLTKAKHPWVKEASQYMLGRVALNLAQVKGFGEYGDLQREQLDAGALDTADAAFKAYLNAYKEGQYSASARGLLRRVYWLQGNNDKLAQELSWQLADSNSKGRSNSLVALAYEADQKLLPELERGNVRDPLLLATLDLQAMRTSELPDDPELRAAKLATLLTYEKLYAQRDAFKGQNDLFEYLLAAHQYYVDKNPKAALDHLPATPLAKQPNVVAFSAQVLRGLALEANKQTDVARNVWLQLIPATTEPLQSSAAQLGLAMNYEKAAQVGNIFASGSPITSTNLRQIILRNIAGPALLAAQAKAKDASEDERRTAQYTLLYKDIIRGHYSAFGADLASAASFPPPPPDSYGIDFEVFNWAGNTKANAYPCPSITVIAKTLALAPRQANALLCMGEFVRINGLDGHSLDSQPPAHELGGGPTEFIGPVFSRGEAYKHVIANTKASRNEVAYALYRAINCYAPGGNNTCGGKDVEEPQRKKWFQTLKSQYKDTSWASRLEYYW